MKAGIQKPKIDALDETINENEPSLIWLLEKNQAQEH